MEVKESSPPPSRIAEVGKQQHFALGQFFRKRYNEFLTETYHYEDIKVISSSVNRCYMSVASNLAGLFPPKGHQLWNPKLPWMPIPIHMIPLPDDAYIAQSKYCPKFKKMASDEAKRLFDEAYKIDKDHFDYLTEKTGFKVDTLFRYRFLWDALFVESCHNQTLPEWTKPVFSKRMEHYVDLQFSSYTSTYALTRLASGPLIDRITGHLENITNKVPQTEKWFMISGHDNTLSCLIKTLNISDHQILQYTSTVIFELRSEGDSYFVNILHKNETYSETLVERTLEGCEFDCEFSKFREIVEPFRTDMETWEAECSKFGANIFQSCGYICFYGIIFHFVVDAF
ncbi:hypothetical protein JTB14_025279 [Gonioctena quinquepunctata]|nr:hypothetical protein JTB14_025279 [Gonioctena quinquepunctata]